MTKILIIAPNGVKELDDVQKMLSGAGHEVVVEEPTPRNLLHTVLGLFSPNAFGFGDEYFVKPSKGDTEQKDQADKPEQSDGDDNAVGKEDSEDKQTTNTEKAEDTADDVFKFESLGTCVLDDIEIDAHYDSNSDYTYLKVEQLDQGQKTTYMLGESRISFWPEKPESPSREVYATINNKPALLKVIISDTAHYPSGIIVGKNDISNFK